MLIKNTCLPLCAVVLFIRSRKLLYIWDFFQVDGKPLGTNCIHAGVVRKPPSVARKLKTVHVGFLTIKPSPRMSVQYFLLSWHMIVLLNSAQINSLGLLMTQHSLSVIMASLRPQTETREKTQCPNVHRNTQPIEELHVFIFDSSSLSKSSMQFDRKWMLDR